MKKELVSPIVNEDYSITFNYESEHARRVEVSGDIRLGRQVVGPGAPVESIPMKKTSNSIWTYTTEPLRPGIYRYAFIVDGIRTLDPINPWRRYPVSQAESMVKVEGVEPMPWDLVPDILHGSIVIEKVYSEILRQVKQCAIYLPPSYQSNRETYPVLYLLHGGGDDYGGWLFDGNADNIMDFLISQGKSKEIIVVMPDGQVLSLEERNRIRRMRRDDPSQANTAIRSMISKKHVDYFTTEVVPFIESRYRVSSDLRVIAGLSMGGSQTLNLITSHQEMFKAAGIFSSGPIEESKDRLTLVKDKIKRIKPIYVSCGNWDSILDISRQLNNLLEELKVDHVYVEADGGHTWSFWSRALIDFLSYL